MRLTDRYDLATIANRTEEMVHEAVEERLAKGELCPCPECVADLVAWSLNHATPQYYTSLLAPLRPDPLRDQRVRVEIDLAVQSGLERLRRHPHHD